MNRRAAAWLGLVVLAGAVLRFATLDVQSLWADEAISAHLLQMDLGAMLRAIPDSESTPPVYYVLAWLWTHVFGTGEVGLRSLSALLGTATIPTVWALARRLGGDHAALAAAALAALNPMLVWFSQEARAYALLALLGTLSALLWLRALEQPRATGRLLAWGAVAALALATHYYAAFLVAPQALWLLVRAPRRRDRAAVLALPLVVGGALAPLAVGQRSNDAAAFITGSPLLTRVLQLPKQFLVGYDAPLEALTVALGVFAALVAIAGIAAQLARAREVAPGEYADTWRLTALTGVAGALPVLAALAGEDHLITRNVLAVLPLACALMGAGIAALLAARSRVVAWLALAAACGSGLVTVVGVARSPDLQRDDWRGAVDAIAPLTAPRLIVTTPGSLASLRYYLPGLEPAAASFQTAEIDYVSLPVRLPGQRPLPPRPRTPPSPAPGFAIAGTTYGPTYSVVRWRAPSARPRPSAVLTGLDGRPAAQLSFVP